MIPGCIRQLIARTILNMIAWTNVWCAQVMTVLRSAPQVLDFCVKEVSIENGFCQLNNLVHAYAQTQR